MSPATDAAAQSVLARLLAGAHTLSRIGIWTAGALTIASVFLIAYDVAVRRLFGITVGGSDELSGYAFAISTSWALAFTVLERANVRVDVVYQHLPVRLAAVLDWLALVALGVFSVYLTHYAWQVALESWTRNAAANTPLATPLWIPQALWVAGLAWFSIVLALLLIRASAALVSGDVHTVQAVCGLRSARDEAQEEAAAGERMVHGARP